MAFHLAPTPDLASSYREHMDFSDFGGRISGIPGTLAFPAPSFAPFFRFPGSGFRVLCSRTPPSACSACSLAGLRPLPWPAAVKAVHSALCPSTMLRALRFDRAHRPERVEGRLSTESRVEGPRFLGCFFVKCEIPPAQCDLRASAGSYAHKGMHMTWMARVRNRA